MRRRKMSQDSQEALDHSVPGCAERAACDFRFAAWSHGFRLHVSVGGRDRIFLNLSFSCC